jgi:site-specific DNA-methyltransferase (adenine-specific)
MKSLPEPTFRTETPQLFPLQETMCADAIDWLRARPSESVDMVNTDVAYESLEKHRAVGTTTRLKVSDGSSNEWFPIFRNVRFPDLFREFYRVMRRNTHLYFWCDAETMFVAKPIAEAAGFKFWKPLIFDKEAIGMGYHYRATYEFILFFEKGHRNLADKGIPDLLTHKRIRGKYPTEKPEDLARILVRQSTQPGELVIDPFMGSGSFGAAAIREGRRFAGCDIKASAVEIAQARLVEARL